MSGVGASKEAAVVVVGKISPQVEVLLKKARVMLEDFEKEKPLHDVTINAEVVETRRREGASTRILRMTIGDAIAELRKLSEKLEDILTVVFDNACDKACKDLKLVLKKEWASPSNDALKAMVVGSKMIMKYQKMTNDKIQSLEKQLTELGNEITQEEPRRLPFEDAIDSAPPTKTSPLKKTSEDVEKKEPAKKESASAKKEPEPEKKEEPKSEPEKTEEPKRIEEPKKEEEEEKKEPEKKKKEKKQKEPKKKESKKKKKKKEPAAKTKKRKHEEDAENEPGKKKLKEKSPVDTIVTEVKAALKEHKKDAAEIEKNLAPHKDLTRILRSKSFAYGPMNEKVASITAKFTPDCDSAVAKLSAVVADKIIMAEIKKTQKGEKLNKCISALQNMQIEDILSM